METQVPEAPEGGVVGAPHSALGLTSATPDPGDGSTEFTVTDTGLVYQPAFPFGVAVGPSAMLVFGATESTMKCWHWLAAASWLVVGGLEVPGTSKLPARSWANQHTSCWPSVSWNGACGGLGAAGA